jgi:hypothetical protein
MIQDFATPGTNGSKWWRMQERSCGHAIRQEDWLKTAILRKSMDDTSLTEEEKRDITILLRALHDAPYWCNDILYLDESHNGAIGVIVEVSEERKTYLDLFSERGLLPENEEDWDKEHVKELSKIRVLGEYVSEGEKQGAIILYINNIKDSARENNAPAFYGLPYLTLTRYVYLHELMHAFFARKTNDGYEYIRDQEEAFAEFGALLLLEQLVKTKPNDDYIPAVNHASEEELKWAIRYVEGKNGVLECYSRGAVLFKQFGHDKDLSKRMLKAYPKPLE